MVGVSDVADVPSASETAVRRIRAVVQYDGTDFCGSQRQAGQRTVQGVLEDALEQLLGHQVTIKASGRTDAGVHARGQVISFTTTGSVPADRLSRAVQTFLPEDVLLSSAQDVPLGFDPQMDAVSKTYCYRLWRDQKQDMFWTRYSHWYPLRLDFDLLNDEARSIVGRHNFVSFRAEGSSAKTTAREVTRAEWIRREVVGRPDALWEFWISADGFLYKMVRLLVGTLLDVGRGHLLGGAIAAAIEDVNRVWVGSDVRIGACAPAKGLCLEEVRYPVT